MLPLILLAVIVHVWGTRTNRRIAKRWIAAHAPVLQQEYAVVGFGGRRSPTLEEVESTGLAQAMASDSLILPDEMFKEKSPQEFTTYASGRLNAAFTDVTLTLLKRYNPISMA